jgi:tetratricopeptide (TPR) repeat protein
LLALCRVREILSDWVPGSPLQPRELRAALETPFSEASLEADRWFAGGWLCWLLGEPENAERRLEKAVQQFEQLGPAADGSEAAYWLARVRLRLHRPEPVTAFEKVLRSRSGSPRATCWFVDLLWRAGQLERAEQVWKTVRSNRKVAATEEAPLLEARLLLHHEEAARAERILGEASLRNGTLQVERDLLLVWTLAALNQTAAVPALLEQARQGPYPVAAVEAWQKLFELRQHPASSLPAPLPDPPWLAAWQRGQQLRQMGRIEEASAAFREALAVPLTRPFPRYALACLGQDDFAAILASQPGLFLAIRCRTQLVAQRFRQRKAGAAEMLDVLHQGEKHGFRLASGDHLRSLALILHHRSVSADELRAFVDAETNADPIVRRNRLRIALELATRCFPAPVALELALEWSKGDFVASDEDLRRILGEQLLGLVLSANPTKTTETETLDTAQRFLGGHRKVALTRAWLHPLGEGDDLAASPTDEALARLWRAAQMLSRGIPSADAQPWRDEVKAIRKSSSCRGLAQGLLVQEAAQRGDVEALVELLNEPEPWTIFSSGPPKFVLPAIAGVVRAQSRSQRLRQSLARWLGNWKLSALEPAAQPLAVHAGLIPLDPSTAEPPSGIPLIPWLLHQATQAISREKYREALTWIRRALTLDSPSIPEAVRAALPDLERLAQAQALAGVLQFHPDQPLPAPGLLAGCVDLLEADPDGQAVLLAASRGETDSVRQSLNRLANRNPLPPPLAHHLALVYHRAALLLEERDAPEAEPCWGLAWRCWLTILASALPAVSATVETAEQRVGFPRGSNERLLLECLLRLHRERINELLIRNDVDGARRHWERVHGLPKRAEEFNPALSPILVEAISAFREELATEYLTATREVMRHGDIPPGWQADYEKGLTYLRRLLSLDRDNLRLLTALVETCTDWFLDCYNNEDAPRLWEQVERFTPFALKLARMIENRADDLTARGVLSEFYKFRGFIADGRERKIALYREALKFNPANQNVRELLAELE